jgi:2-methylcitrate dehydratase PrpD
MHQTVADRRTGAASAAAAPTAPAASSDGIATGLARFVHGLRLDDVPAASRLRASHLMLDAIGCALAARREDFAARLVPAIASLADGSGGRGVIGHGLRLPLREAVWINGALAHGLDYDDTHMAGVIHLTVSVFPALLSLGAQRRASGAQVLLAYVAGLEAGARIASVVRGGLHAQGFHPTGVVGTFASALAAGKLLGLSEDRLVAAQGIALSLASGSLQFLEDGAWTKRLHPGWAAQAGIQAAGLAAHDIPAPTAPYEGRFGLLRSHLGPLLQAQTEPALGTAGLGERWELEQIAIKPFPMCHFVHAATDAAIALHAQHPEIGAIARVDVAMPEGTLPVVCEPIDAKRRPRSDYDAKFSLPYAVASGLLRGRLGLRELLPDAWTDARALALMDRVHCHADPESTFPRHYTGEVRITFTDGRTVTHREAINRGHAERPLSNAEIRRKFDDNATLHFGAAFARALAGRCLALADEVDVAAFENLLACDPEATS